MKRCDRRATRAFLEGIAGILDAPSGGARRRRAKALYLEFFRTEGADRIDRMIETAVGEWGVEHLDVVVLRSAPRDPPLPFYTFPDHLLDDEHHCSRLRSLTLGYCVLPPLHRYTALERLVLQDTAPSTPMSVYGTVFNDCGAPLRVVHLLCCRGASDVLEVDAPFSGVQELVVEECSFRAIELRDLPELRYFACLADDALELRLIVRFTGPKRWILARPLDTTLLGLRELLVADVPSSWDVSWPRLLLEAATELEILHIHVSQDASSPGEHQRPEGRAIHWQPRKFRHRRLREVYMVGFRNTPRQIRFLRYLVRVCKPLQHVMLARDGRIEEDGLWAWKTVDQKEDCSWSLADWMLVNREIKRGRCWSKRHVRVILE
ncbi:hypothetical protein E2562_017661 [Oryza meyeriana var. granulata]|uniref:FBD domain-containing protein n=1 Tax=Oryza meyeriana var. granulata TaxID=110450 RepID=A0A6G1BWG0_9ORYZ|nr:hypothetical protein E2562_017661 [Oryza meyeriana var. granulata]